MKSDTDYKKKTVLIRTPDHRLRVFVSSTLRELEPERKAVNKAITRLRLAPVMFESGARPHPAQDLYQAYLSQSHVFIGIYWQSYGWIGPGMQISGVEDEYNRSNGIPRLIYIKNPAPNQDPALKHMLERIKAENCSSYKYFETTEELRELIENDLVLLLTEYFETARAEVEPSVILSPTSVTNVPIPRNPLIGRERELQMACDLLLNNEVALLTLTGPAGTGKSRLAIQIALELRDQFGDGVFMIMLESIRDPGLVIPIIAKTLNIPESSSELSTIELLKMHLCQRQVLLLLDNFEQVQPAAPQVAELLEACPKVKILVTSRAALHLRAERELPIPPLALPPLNEKPELQPLSQYAAVKLFIQRCQGVKADFKVTNDNAPIIAEICHHLDGLPLAIELAAARIKLLPPKALLSRLERRFEVLRGGTRDLPERHRTMYSAIDWSYNLLENNQKRLFQRLSVFNGGWSLEAATNVCGSENQERAEILDSLEMLVDNNLLRPPEEEAGEPRLRMLESIREFAYDRLKDSGEAESIHLRHAQYFASMAEQAEREKFGDEQQRTWRVRLEAELDNMRAAMSWALENDRYACELRIATGLWRFWWTHGTLREGIKWLQRGLAGPEPSAGEVRAKALTRMGWMLNKIGDTSNSIASIQEAISLWRQIDDQAGLAQALSNLGAIMLPVDIAKGTAMLEDALRIRRSLGNHRGVYATLMNLGLAAFRLGNTQRMIELFTESLIMAREVKDYYSMGVTLINLGDAYTNEGDYKQAEGCFSEAEDVYQTLGDRAGLAEVRRGQGRIALKRGNHAQALSLLSDALQISSDTEIISLTLVILELIAFVSQQMNDTIKTAHLLSACESLRSRMKISRIPIHQVDCEIVIANARAALDEDTFNKAWLEGSLMTLDQSVAYGMRQ